MSKKRELDSFHPLSAAACSVSLFLSPFPSSVFLLGLYKENQHACNDIPPTVPFSSERTSDTRRGQTRKKKRRRVLHPVFHDDRSMIDKSHESYVQVQFRFSSRSRSQIRLAEEDNEILLISCRRKVRKIEARSTSSPFVTFFNIFSYFLHLPKSKIRSLSVRKFDN